METNNSYTSKVDSGQWPENCEVPLDVPYEDERGIIQNLILKPVTSITMIKTKAGNLRSNHYHKTDWHYIYVVSGCLLYYERKVGSTIIPEPRKFEEGSLFFTPPMMEHCTAFLEDTILITASKNIRSHEKHEEDLVRVNFITVLDVKW